MPFERCRQYSVTMRSAWGRAFSCISRKLSPINGSIIWDNVILQYSIYVPIHDHVQFCTRLRKYSSPNHNWTRFKTLSMAKSALGISFTFSSPDYFATIGPGECIWHYINTTFSRIIESNIFRFILFTSDFINRVIMVHRRQNNN